MAENTRHMKGPMGMRGSRPKVENPGKIMKRLLGYMLKNYKIQFFIVVVCIIITACTTLRGMLFMQSLIDDYIIPMTKVANPDFGPLKNAILNLVATYAVGVISAYAYNRIMVNIGQGTMLKLRTDLFTHMESLPIKYFDTNAHGDIMSVYTNDVDTLRQLMSQSIPQTINSAVTIIMTFVSMIVLDIPLTIISLLMVGLMMFTTSRISKKTGRFFADQQRDLGKVNGFIEEMMEGQKVIKVFCHEEKVLKNSKN